MSHPNAFDRAVSAIRQAQAVALHTGAGMGVDSGLTFGVLKGTERLSTIAPSWTAI